MNRSRRKPAARRLHSGPYGAHRESTPERIRGLGWHGLALIVSAIFLVPLAAMFVGSLRTPGLPPPIGIEWLPSPLAWGNYGEVFRLVEMGRYMLNSLVVVAMAVPITLLVASWAGFALAHLPNRLARRVIVLSLLLLLLPETSLWVSRFMLYKFAHILDTPLALVAPSLMGTSPLYMLVFYWTFRRVSLETWDAARVDGAGAFRMWWFIGVPAARAAYAGVGVLAFVYYWREFREPLLYIQTISKYTVSVGLAYLEQLDRTNLPILLAGSVIVTLPLVIIFILAQRFFMEPWERVSTSTAAAPSPDDETVLRP